MDKTLGYILMGVGALTIAATLGAFGAGQSQNLNNNDYVTFFCSAVILGIGAFLAFR